MDDVISRMAQDLFGRLYGIFNLRFVFQPAAAVFYAIRDGREDAIEGRPPYLWTLLTDPSQRAGLLRECWHAVKRVYVVAVLIDVIYQLIVLHWIYPGESLIVALVLAFVPYMILRGSVCRLTRRFAPSPGIIP